MIAAQGIAHAEEGKFTFSDPRAYIGTTRTITLRWEPLEISDMAFDDFERHPLGTIKTVRQKYIYGSDELAGGFSYYWYPHAGGGY
ncbi:hypothetical protein LVJ83_13260 [Uruburuella testudinis]|uniref:Uncharacterized protein n=1 Tax=Uruburuella testudinis TaxID=1282863 RepID=A0ABY4DTV3_9NEIS|nr:hypothetical protein [Uruburuella testudinis]UOO81853.1 hypothetical protein LVJ83_13260 [Uruburuella testudinis]